MKTSAPRGSATSNLGIRSRQHPLPAPLNLWQQVDERIRLYIERLMKLSPDDAFRLQKIITSVTETTLRGLMLESWNGAGRFP